VIAAAVIGGTSLAGGLGSVPRAVFGGLIIQSLNSGLVLLGVQSAWQQIIIGFVLLVAAQLDAIITRRRPA